MQLSTVPSKARTGVLTENSSRSAALNHMCIFRVSTDYWYNLMRDVAAATGRAGIAGTTLNLPLLCIPLQNCCADSYPLTEELHCSSGSVTSADTG